MGAKRLSSAETRLEAKRALKASAFSASATGSRGGSVAGGGCVAGVAPPVCAVFVADRRR